MSTACERCFDFARGHCGVELAVERLVRKTVRIVLVPESVNRARHRKGGNQSQQRSGEH